LRHCFIVFGDKIKINLSYKQQIHGYVLNQWQQTARTKHLITYIKHY